MIWLDLAYGEGSPATFMETPHESASAVGEPVPSERLAIARRLLMAAALAEALAPKHEGDALIEPNAHALLRALWQQAVGVSAGAASVDQQFVASSCR